MRRRTFLKFGANASVTTTMSAALSAALSACGGNGGDAPGSSGDPGNEPVAPVAPAAPAGIVAGWTGTALAAVRAAKPGPPMAARSLAIMYTCMYDAWCAYDVAAMPALPGTAPRRPAAERTAGNKAMAMSHAAYTALADQFPGERARFDTYMKELGYDPAQASLDPATPAGLGTAAAQAEVVHCHTDGSNQLGDLAPGAVPYADYTGYAPKNPPLVVGQPTPRTAIADPSHWQPLSYADTAGRVLTPAYLGPAWDRVRPFALASGGQYRPPPPALYGSGAYADEVARIIELQGALTEEQKVIAEYWADNPGTNLPPGHWLAFGLYVSARDRHTDDDDVKMFFALANALSDAAIAAWDAKRAYDSARPITAVRYLMHGQTIRGYGLSGPAGGLGSIPGETWMPFQAPTFPTPPFPEYVSGHSTFSAAAAEVLARFTGSDVFGAQATQPARSMFIEPGMPANDLTLGWATFSAAAEQAGMSRVYGGIHFEDGNAAGLQLGRKVGAQAFAKAQGLWQGRA